MYLVAATMYTLGLSYFIVYTKLIYFNVKKLVVDATLIDLTTQWHFIFCHEIFITLKNKIYRYIFYIRTIYLMSVEFPCKFYMQRFAI